MCVHVIVRGPIYSEHKSNFVVCSVYNSVQYGIHPSFKNGPKKLEPIEVCVHKVHVRCFWLRTRDHFRILEAHLTVRATLQNTMVYILIPMQMALLQEHESA